MSIDDLVSVVVSSTGAAPTQAGFGTPLLCCYHTVGGSARVLQYDAATALTDMVSAGFSATSAPYAMASLVLQQTPRPPKIKIGRRALAFTQVFKLKCLSATAGDVYAVTVGTTDVAYTVPSSGSPTTSTVATAIALLIAAISGVASATAVTDTITVTATTAGALLRVKNWSPLLFTYADTTADPGLATDLAAIKLEDNDWYGLTIDTASPANITAAAAFAEANQKLMAQHTNDTACGDPASTTDIMYTQNALAPIRIYLQFQGSDNYAFAGAAMLGSRLPITPGSDTWHEKTLVGVPVETAKTLSSTAESAIIAKKGNVYVKLLGVNVTRGGFVSGGTFADTTRGRDELVATMQTRVFAKKLTLQKISYTDGDIAALQAVAQGVLDERVGTKFLKASPAPKVSVVPVDQVSEVDRAARVYNGMTFTAFYAGAVHKAGITGVIGV